MVNPPRKSGSLLRRAKLGLILVLSTALILVVTQNTAPVLARFLWFSGEVPVILLLFLTGIGGFNLGILVVLLNMREKKPEPPREYTERTYRS